MGNEIYTKLTTIYLAELGRLEDKVVQLNNLMMTTDYDCSIVVAFASAKSNLDYYKKFMGDVLEFFKYYDR